MPQRPPTEGSFTENDNRAKIAGTIGKKGPGIKGMIEKFFHSSARDEHIQKMEKEGIDTGEGTKLEFLIAKLYQMAIKGKGNIQAFKILFAYFEGLPIATHEHFVGGSESLNQIAEKLLNEHTPEEIVQIVKYELD